MKKMMILAIIALVAMMGAASATGSNILDENENNLPYVVKIVPGSTTVYGLSVGEGLPEAGTEITYVITSLSPDLQVNQLKTTAILDGGNTFVDADVFELTLSPSAPVGAQYKIIVKTYINGEVLTDEEFLASASQRFESIPEFPTVALPVAAILGLAFFMQRRKEE